MKITKYLLLLFTITCLSGCGLYSKWSSTNLEYDVETICDVDTVTPHIAEISWKELFNDPYLVAWIDTALCRNVDLRIAQYKVEQAAATLKASRLAFLPSVGVNAEGSVGNNSSDRFQIAPAASWEIDIFGKQRNLKKGAEAAYYASDAYCQAVRTYLISAVANGYYTLLMLDEQLDISERTLKTWDENIRVLQALKRAGRTNEAAVLQARANRMKVENSAITLRQQISAQENAIKSLLLNPETNMTRGKFEHQNFPDSLSKGIPVKLLSNRPDVKEALYHLQKCFYDVNVMKAAFYPTLTLSGSAGWLTTSGGSVGSPSTWIANLLGSIAAPIFNRGTNDANLKIAKAEYEIASLNFQQKLLDAGMEVNDALTSWQTAHDRLTLDKKQIVALRGAVHNTRLLMRNTNTNYLEVLTAQQRLLDAELTEAADRYDAIQSIITLYHALGGGTE